MVTANDVVVDDEVVVVNGRRRGREEENAFTPLDETMAATTREAQTIFMVKDTGGGEECANLDDDDELDERFDEIEMMLKR